MEQQIAPLLEKLAAKLGTTVEHLWGVLIQQAKIEGWVGIFYLVSSFILVLCVPKFISVSFKKFNKRTSYDMFEEKTLGVRVGVCIISCIVIIIFIANITQVAAIITAFANPEYWALHRILSLLNK